MKIIEVENYDQMSAHAAKMISDTVRGNSKTVLGLATGGTPVGTYKYLVDDYQKNHISYQQVHTVNLDEYVGVGREHNQSYFHYMNKRLFKAVDLPEEQAFLPNGLANNPVEEAFRYNQIIESLGGVDLQILGIGLNGHIGFNEPGTPFDSQTHVVQLTASTREANAKYFSSIEEVPTHAITMGIATIMKAKHILLLVSGKQKAEILYKSMYEEVDEHIPASVMRRHSNVTIIADREALAVIKDKEGEVTS